MLYIPKTHPTVCDLCGTHCICVRDSIFNIMYAIISILSIISSTFAIFQYVFFITYASIKHSRMHLRVIHIRPIPSLQKPPIVVSKFSLNEAFHDFDLSYQYIMVISRLGFKVWRGIVHHEWVGTVGLYQQVGLGIQISNMGGERGSFEGIWVCPYYMSAQCIGNLQWFYVGSKLFTISKMFMDVWGQNDLQW